MSDQNIDQASVDTANVGTVIPGEAAAVSNEANEVEVRARSMGWVPKDDFRGPEDKWRSAEDFVRRGEEELPVLRERNRDLSRKYTELETRIQQQEREFAARVQRQEQMAGIALRQQRETLEQQYEMAKRDAVAMGDQQRYDQLNRDHRTALNQFDETVYQAARPQQQQPQNQGPSPDQQVKLNAWLVENPWFVADTGLARYAEAVHTHINTTKPNLSVEENLAEVTKIVRERFPDKFGQGGNGRAPSVEGGSGLKSGATRSRGVSDLPDEARRAADEFVRAGAFKSVAEYAKSYWAMEGA